MPELVRWRESCEALVYLAGGGEATMKRILMACFSSRNSPSRLKPGVSLMWYLWVVGWVGWVGWGGVGWG